MYKIDSKVESIYSSFIPLTPKSTLRWIGFSDYGSLCFLDSTGTLQLLIKSYWSPLCYVDSAVIHCCYLNSHHFYANLNFSVERYNKSLFCYWS